MIVHFYGLCWNDAPMLPFFFGHYDALIDRYFIFDHRSTDGSLDLLRAHPKVEVDEFHVAGDSFVESARDFYNEAWKASRGVADWVVVANLDEHLYHADFRGFLARCEETGISIIQPRGYEMVALRFPRGSRPLLEQVRVGKRTHFMDKPQIFRPDSIHEINFAAGRHAAAPKGEVRFPARAEMKLLHFKQLGLNRLPARQNELRDALRGGDIARNWAGGYFSTRAQHQMRLLYTRWRAEEVIFPISPTTRLLRWTHNWKHFPGARALAKNIEMQVRKKKI